MVLGGLALAVPAAGDAPRRNRPGAGTANPSALVATEIAFNRMAREKGQWTAFREYADEAGVMFVSDPVLARDWLKGRADPLEPVQWEPYRVWMSCDGTLGVTEGSWTRPDGTFGYYTTIWKRQKKGEYRWVLDQGDALAAPLEKPDWLTASVADCPAPQPWAARPERKEDGKVAIPAPGPAGGGASADGTLRWTYAVAPDKSRELTIALVKDGQPVGLRFTAAAPKAP